MNAIIDSFRITFWNMAMGGLLGFAGSIYDVILFLPSLLGSLMSSSFVQNMVTSIGIIAGALCLVMLLLTAIRTMQGQEDAFLQVKKMVTACIFVVCFPMVFSFGLSLTTAGINDVDNIIAGGTTNITFIEEIANGWWHISDELTPEQQSQANQATNGGNPFGTESCTILSCKKKLTYRVDGEDKNGDKKSYALEHESFIVGLIFSFALIFLLFLAGTKIIGYMGKLILYNIFGPIFVLLGTNGYTADYMKNYFVKLTQTFIALFVQVFSISFSALLIGVLLEFVDRANLDPTQHLIAMIICIIGGLMIMIGGSDFFIDMFSTDTGVESVVNSYIGGRAVKGAWGGISGAVGSGINAVSGSESLGNVIKENSDNNHNINNSTNDEQLNTDILTNNDNESNHKNENMNDLIDNDSININDDCSNISTSMNDDIISSYDDVIGSYDDSKIDNNGIQSNETNVGGNESIINSNDDCVEMETSKKGDIKTNVGNDKQIKSKEGNNINTNNKSINENKSFEKPKNNFSKKTNNYNNLVNGESNNHKNKSPKFVSKKIMKGSEENE